MLGHSRQLFNVFSVEVFGPIPENAENDTLTIVFSGEDAAIAYARSVQGEVQGVRVSKRIVDQTTGRLMAIRTIFRAGLADQTYGSACARYQRH